MFVKSLSFSFFMSLLMASTVFAHSGHGSTGLEMGVIHYISQPVHIGLALGVMGCLIFVLLVRKNLNRQNGWE